MRQPIKGSNTTQKEIIILILLVAFSIFLRAYNLNALSGGDDSAWAELTYFTIQNPSNILYPSFPDEPIERSGMTLVRFFGVLPLTVSTLIFGYTSLAMLLPSIICAAGSVLLLYYILRKQFNPTTAMVGTAIFTASPLYIAFTRIASFDSQLIFTLLLAIAAYTYAVEKKDNRFFYIAAAACLINFMTSEIRGLIPIVAVIPYLILKKIDREQWKHAIISALAAGIIYCIYIFLPVALGFYAPAEELLGSFIHGAGQRATSVNYLPVHESIKTLGSYLFFTPFAMLIFIPMLYGIYTCIRSAALMKRRSDNRTAEHSLWAVFVLTSAIFYLQGQPYPQRQLIYTAAFATLATIGLLAATDDLIKRRKTGYVFLTGAFAVHIILFFKWFPTLFPAEYAGIEHILSGLGLSWTFDLISAYGYPLIAFVIVITAAIAAYLKWNPNGRRLLNQRKTRKRIAYTLLGLFIGANVLLATALVITGIGIYHRPDEIITVANYINENKGDEQYSCVAGVHENSLIYYTQSMCAFWPEVDTNWLEEKSRNGQVKFFIIEKHFDYNTPGFGDIDEMRADIDANPHTNEMSLWSGNYRDKYEWLMENTVDVTEEAGLAKGNPHFEIYRLK